MSDKLVESVYKDFLDDKKIILNGEIDRDSISEVAMMIKKWNIQDDREEKNTMCSHCNNPSFDRKKEPIYVFINSGGGCYSSSMAICSAILSSKTPVITSVVGFAGSGAALIAMCGHKRIASRYSRIMIHQGSLKIRGEMTHANILMDECNRETLEMLNFISSHSKIKLKELKEKTSGKDWYFTAEEAKVAGLIDEVE